MLQSTIRRRLDEHLSGLEVRVGPHPPFGWIRTIRLALGMSTLDLGRRMGLTQSRISQIERAELDGSVRLSTLRRAATSLECTFRYALVPSESLDSMVYRQALVRAAAMINPSVVADRTGGFLDWLPATEAGRIEELAEELMDQRGLWT